MPTGVGSSFICVRVLMSPPEPDDAEFVWRVRGLLAEARARAFETLGISDPNPPRLPATGYCRASLKLGWRWEGRVFCSFRAVHGGYCRRHARERGLLPAVMENGNGNRWTRAAIIEAIQRWARDHGGLPPTTGEWKFGGEDHPSYGVVKRVCGSWPDAIEEAGFPRPCRGRGYAWERERLSQAV